MYLHHSKQYSFKVFKGIKEVSYSHKYEKYQSACIDAKLGKENNIC